MSAMQSLHYQPVPSQQSFCQRSWKRLLFGAVMLVLVVAVAVTAWLVGYSYQGDRSDLLCHPPYESVDGECFHVVTTTGSWSEAKDHCEGMGGRLAMPNNVPALVSFINKKYPYRPYEGYWLGATDLNPEGKWRYEDGRQVPQEQWFGGDHNNPRQPNNFGGNQHCLGLSIVYHPPFADQSCSGKLPSVCEYMGL